jgi:TIGR03009 family protein
MVLTTLLLAAPLAGAQQTAPPAQPAPRANAPAAAAPAQPATALDGYLQQWEQAMQKVDTLAAQLSRAEKDVTFNQVQKFTGYAAYMRKGSGGNVVNLAMLEMHPEGKAEVSEKFVCTGTYLYSFVPPQKELRAYELPKPKPGQVADDGFLSFLFGMKAEEAKRRYDLKLTKEDKWYVYIEIQPRDPRDKADFKRARLVLDRSTFLPRQLWFEHPNGSDVTWEIPNIKSGVDLNRTMFDAPRTPPGWKLVPVPLNSNTPPRVMRGNG